jgi:hypothetical protein
MASSGMFARVVGMVAETVGRSGRGAMAAGTAAGTGGVSGFAGTEATLFA